MEEVNTYNILTNNLLAQSSCSWYIKVKIHPKQLMNQTEFSCPEIFDILLVV